MAVSDKNPSPVLPGNSEDRGLTALATRRPVGVTMVALSVVVFGVISFQRLPQNLMPDISYPSLTVRTEYPGAAPIDVEQRLSRRLEEAMAQVRNLRRVSSISRAEVSDVILEFAWGTEMSFATAEVREKVSQVVLPDEAESPTFLRYDPTLDPILQVGLYRERARGTEDDVLIALRIFAEDELEQALESISGVAGVRVRGGLEKEVRIDVREERLREKGLSIDRVSERVRQENLNQASGILYEGTQSRAVRTVNEFRDLEEIRDVVLRWEGSVPIRLRDIAEVSFGYKDPEVITRINGKPCVKIDVYKEADANVVEVAGRVRDRLFGTPEERARFEELRRRERRFLAKTPPDAAGKKDGGATQDGDGDGQGRKGVSKRQGGIPSRPDFLETRLRDGMKLELMSDQSVFIRDALDDVRRAVLAGGFLAVIVLYFFLRRAWFTLAVGLSIPLSIMATFVAMHLFGVSLNMMSLGGLALGIGMLVDSSIVVLESIFRCREEGDAPGRAAVRGTRIVASAVTASTLTTVAVFFPIVFVEGVAGQMFRDQALAVVLSLLASLVVALYFIPALVCRKVGDASSGVATSHDVERARGDLLWRFLRRPGRFPARADLRSRLRSLRWRPWWRTPLSALAVLWTVPVFVIELAVELVLFLLFWAAAGARAVLRFALRKSSPAFQKVGGGVFGAFDRVLERTHRIYLRLLGAALDRGLTTALLALIAALLSFGLLRRIETELIPAVRQGEFTVDVRLPRSTRIEETDRIIRPWEEALLSSDRFRGVASITTTIGVEPDEPTAGDAGEHTAKLLVRLRPSNDLVEREEELKAEIRRTFQSAEFETVEITNPVLFSFKTPIEVEVSGRDLERLTLLVNRIHARLEEMPELEDVKANIARGDPEVQLQPDRDMLARYDLGGMDVGTLLRQKIQGEIASYYSLGDRKVPIRVRLDEGDRDTLEELRELAVHREAGLELRLKDVVGPGALERLSTKSPGFVIGEGPAEIRRIAHQRAGVITANLAGMSLGAATEKIQGVLRDIESSPDFPAAFTVGFGGQKKEMDRALESLRSALLLAVFLVYVVMAMQFESLAQPLIIIVSIPLALVGVFPALYLLGKPLSIVVFIGMIVLAGIVVNNAIVLVDTANQLRRGGLPLREALMRAGELRLRPILMTTATTVLGLLPLTGVFGAIDGLEPLTGTGRGEEVRAPLAITVIVGLVTSTVLTLVVIPVIASLLDRVLSYARPSGAAGTPPIAGEGGADVR